MTACRSTSFYIAPGELRYFKDHTVCAKHPSDGTLVEFTHRRDISRFQQENPDWDGIIMVGPAGGAGTIEHLLETDPAEVDLFRTSARVIEGRRPEDVAAYTEHKWSTSGLEAAGGARQVIEALFPGAGRAVTAKAAGLASAGCIWQTQVLGAAWRAGLIDDPHMASRLLTGVSQAGIATFADPRVEPLLRHLQELRADGVDVDVEAILLELAGPALHLDEGAIATLAADPDCPPELLASFASHASEWVRLDTVNNPSTPHEALARLAEDESQAVRQAVAENRNCPQDALIALAQDPSPDVRQALARNPSAPPEALAALVERAGSTAELPETILTIARNPACTPDTLAQLAEARRWDPDTLYAIASNPSAAPDLLTRLADPDHTLSLSDDEHAKLRESLADNPATPQEVLSTFADDPSATVRARLVTNPSAPPEARQTILAAEDSWVSVKLAARPDCPPEVLAELSGHDARTVRWEVARNKSTPPETLRRLAAAWADEYGADDETLIIALASNPSTPADLLVRLAERKVPQAAQLIASNPSATPEAIRHVVDGASEYTIFRALSNPAAPAETLLAYAGHKDHHIRQAVAEHPSTPPEAFEMLLGAEGQDLTIFATAVSNPACPPELLDRLAHDPDLSFTLREAVARSSACTSETLTHLAGDRHPYVRQAAAGNLRLPYEKIPPSVLAEHRDIAHERQIREGAPVDLQISAKLSGAILVDPAETRKIGSLDDLDLRHNAKIIPQENRQLAGETAGLRRGFVVEPLATSRQLRTNAQHMGNCTAGYEQRIRRGDSLLFTLTDEKSGDVYNAELHQTTDGEKTGWELGEVNSRFNRGVDDKTHKRIAKVFRRSTR